MESQTEDFVTLRFAVSDTGIGIPKEKQELIFRPFEQADTSTSRRFVGTHLGLSICERLVAAMGGRMWVESEIGTGSTFFFTASFGLARAEDYKDKITGSRALVVDENAASRRLLTEVLLRAGLKPLAVASGEEALAEIQSAEKPIPFVLVDDRIAGMNDLTLLEQIRMCGGDATRLIVLTANAQFDVGRERATRLARWLLKPVSRFELLEALEAESRKGSSGTSGRRGGRILLAEDNKINQVVAKKLLENHGFQVAVAENGLQALALFERESFDLCLMDMQMPEMDGLCATEEIRRREASCSTSLASKRLPVIALTANAMAVHREACLTSGMDDYLTKPFVTHELLHVLDHWLRVTDAGGEQESAPACTEAM